MTPPRRPAASASRKKRTRTRTSASKTRGRSRIRKARPDPERVKAILQALDREYPQAACSLRHKNPFQLLIATILSAQCTDERVNIVTRELFKVAPTPKKLAALPREKVEDLIRSTGFFRNKARSIQEAARMIVEEYGGRVPDEMEDLLRLPGVARKTANVVLGTAYGKAEGIVVDTHVKRIARLLGLTHHTDPNKIEQDLMRIIPRDHWISFTHQIIEHGRKVCIARRPRCAECVLAPHCPSAS